MDQAYEAGWGISNGWQVGGANPSTGQVGWASENNVRLIPGVGLTMTVPGRKSLDKSTFIQLTTYISNQVNQRHRPATPPRKSPSRG